MASILTNNAAKIALQTLTSTMKNLETTQNRIATGLRVADASDNAAYWSIATTMRADSSSLSTVSDALNLGATTVDVASKGVNDAIEIVKKLRNELIGAATPGVDRQKYQDAISQYQSQLRNLAESASFNGQNWLSVNSSDVGYNATKSIVASFSRDAAGSVSVGTIEVNTSRIVLFDNGISVDTVASGNAADVLNTVTEVTDAAAGQAEANAIDGGTGNLTIAATTQTEDDGTAANNDWSDLSLVIGAELLGEDFDVASDVAVTKSYAAEGTEGVVASYDSETGQLTITSTAATTAEGGAVTGAYAVTEVVIDNIELSGKGILDNYATATAGTWEGTAVSVNASVTDIDIAALTDSATDLATLNAYMNVADAAIEAMTQAGSELGSVKSRVTSQQTFVDSLRDSIDKGVGALVDADMNEESTRLQALQVQQQLGVQALSIANQTSQSILSLFR